MAEWRTKRTNLDAVVGCGTLQVLRCQRQRSGTARQRGLCLRRVTEWNKRPHDSQSFFFSSKGKQSNVLSAVSPRYLNVIKPTWTWSLPTSMRLYESVTNSTWSCQFSTPTDVDASIRYKTSTFSAASEHMEKDTVRVFFVCCPIV